MKIPIFNGAVQRVSRSRLKRVMRGYRFLKATGQLDLIGAVQDELARARFARLDRNASKLLFGAGVEEAELVVSQFLLTRIGGLRLNEVLLHSLGAGGSPIVYPMPKSWQEAVARHGFRVARMRCSLAWAGYIFIFWVYGALSIVQHLSLSLYEMIRPRVPVQGRYAYFVGLTAGNLPQPCRDGRSHDIVTWYSRWKGRAGHLAWLAHGVSGAKARTVNGLSVRAIRGLPPALDSLGCIVRLVSWGLVAVSYSLLDLARGRWWHALLLAESATAALVRFQRPEKLARDYLFYHSDGFYRPLWTYEAEEKGSRIIVYFYSTNCEWFKRRDGYLSLTTASWQVMNWPLYLVWDEYQEGFLRRVVDREVNVEIVGPVWFQSSSVEMPRLPAGSVAVFDVQPLRNSRYQILGAAHEYYIPQIADQFISDVHAVIRECKGAMVHKRKRNIGRTIHPGYENLMKIYANVDGFFQIEPGISAARVIEACSAVISMPFTSTALVGRELGRPSVYYDPGGIVQKDDRAAHGIQILSGRDELRMWLSGVLHGDHVL